MTSGTTTTLAPRGERAELAEGLGLPAVVQLLPQHAADLAPIGRQFEPTSQAAEREREPVEGPEVGVDIGRTVGVLDLDGGRPPVPEDGAVDLPY